jgi:ferredoxin-type protein NapF
MAVQQARSRRWFLTAGAARAPAGRLTISDACLAQMGVVCQACGDTCPEQAIRFEPRRGGPPVPTVDEHRCTACGLCAPICPVGAISLPESAA